MNSWKKCMLAAVIVTAAGLVYIKSPQKNIPPDLRDAVGEELKSPDLNTAIPVVGDTPGSIPVPDAAAVKTVNYAFYHKDADKSFGNAKLNISEQSLAGKWKLIGRADKGDANPGKYSPGGLDNQWLAFYVEPSPVLNKATLRMEQNYLTLHKAIPAGHWTKTPPSITRGRRTLKFGSATGGIYNREKKKGIWLPPAPGAHLPSHIPGQPAINEKQTTDYSCRLLDKDRLLCLVEDKAKVYADKKYENIHLSEYQLFAREAQ